MSTLLNTSRFMPWLKQIVRNQAYMRLRRGGQHGREQSFTSLETSPASWDQVDWRNIDSILFHVSRSVSERGREQDPSAVMMRKEIIDNIRALLHCLSQRERAIFEAHFFRHLSIQDIADQLGTPKANVYNHLSRSRKKVQKERIKVYFADYAKRRAQEKLLVRNVLAVPFEL